MKLGLRNACEMLEAYYSNGTVLSILSSLKCVLWRSCFFLGRFPAFGLVSWNSLCAAWAFDFVEGSPNLLPPGLTPKRRTRADVNSTARIRDWTADAISRYPVRWSTRELCSPQFLRLVPAFAPRH